MKPKNFALLVKLIPFGNFFHKSTKRWLGLIPYILAMCLVAKANASNIDPDGPQETVSGTVVDFEGTPLPGANIIEKGTTNGTQTDFDGNFVISIGQDATLVVSYIGS